MRFTIAFSTALVVLAVSIAMGCVIGYGILSHLRKMLHGADRETSSIRPLPWTGQRLAESDRETTRQRDNSR